jgi:hypothetical protein
MSDNRPTATERDEADGGQPTLQQVANPRRVRWSTAAR